MDNTYFIRQPLTSFIFALLVIPILISILNKHQIHELPGIRKVHVRNVPSLGGVGIFLGFFFSILFWWPQEMISQYRLLIGALVLMFVIGLRDDLLPLSPMQKLISQIIPMVVLLFAPLTQITSLYGLYGIYELPFYVGLPLTLFTLVVIVNSINLIDGADGLAGSLGFTYSAILGLWFLLAGQTELVLISWSFCGAILGFLLFNWKPAKIFMGDTGALMIGLIISFLTIQFLNHNANLTLNQPFKLNGISTSLLILFIPLFDTLRLFILRLAQRKSPFEADKNHIHHFLMIHGLNHAKVTLVLVVTSIVLIAIAIPLRKLTETESLLVVLIIATIYAITISYAFRKKADKIPAGDEVPLMKVSKGDQGSKSRAS